MYPYQDEFARWCRYSQQLSPKSIFNANHVLTNFFNYARRNFAQDGVASLTVTEVRDYLDQLDAKEHLSVTTINKYISYLKKYFYFLNTTGIIDNYPLLELKGISFERRKTYVINWMDHIADFIPVVRHEFTIYLLTLTALGYKSRDLLKVHWSQVKDRIKDQTVKDYIHGQLDFTENPDPYLFAARGGEPYASTNNVMQLAKGDKLLIKDWPMTLTNLRLSYVYSVIASGRYTDGELLGILDCDLKRLAYYQYNASYCHLIPYSKDLLES